MTGWNAWLSLSLQGARLAWEAQNVIALRLLRMGLHDARAHSEAKRMISEKFAALGEAQAAALTGAARGQQAPAIANKVMTVYRKRVGRNRRRLSR